MTFPIMWIIFLVLFSVLPFGCVGKDRALLMTKTNVGLDIDTTPPTAEITIARRELAIQPTFQNNDKGKDTALPLLATFGKTGSYFNPGITGHFAGGLAAVLLTTPSEIVITEDILKDLYAKSKLCLTQNPFNSDNPPKEKIPRPFYFATDTSYGLKVAWSGTTAAYPDSLKLGYNRKEFASPPIFVDVEGSCPEGNPQGHKVELPSFYAAIDNASGFSTFYESGVDQVQVFATGEAATGLAKDKYIREIAYNHMAPKAAKLKESRLGLQEALVEEIISEFEKDTASKKDILDKGAELELIPKGTTETQFPDALRAHVESLEPDIATKLNDLRLFAAKKQGTQ
jgi:hypothetical protein